MITRWRPGKPAAVYLIEELTQRVERLVAGAGPHPLKGLHLVEHDEQAAVPAVTQHHEQALREAERPEGVELAAYPGRPPSATCGWPPSHANTAAGWPGRGRRWQSGSRAARRWKPVRSGDGDGPSQFGRGPGKFDLTWHGTPVNVGPGQLKSEAVDGPGGLHEPSSTTKLTDNPKKLAGSKHGTMQVHFRATLEDAMTEDAMTSVLIQPSYGRAAARRRWQSTLGTEVPFGSSPFADSLSTDELQALDAFHPSQRARFWAATGTHDRTMSKLRTGDVVLFTGQLYVRAVGEVGITFRNADFADLLWTPDEPGRSWRNVYSLIGFRPVLIPYEELRSLTETSARDNFMSLRLLSGDKADKIVSGLSIETSAARAQDEFNELRLTDSLKPGISNVIDVENFRTFLSSYRRDSSTVVVRRGEALLVQSYRESLGGYNVTRLMTAVGPTDLYLERDNEIEIVEAKSGNGHSFVRQLSVSFLTTLSIVHEGHPVWPRFSRVDPVIPTSHSCTTTGSTAFTGD